MVSVFATPEKPEPFLTLRIHDLATTPSHTGVCVGYERGAWRAGQLVAHLFEWLPEFALAPDEWSDIRHSNAVQLLRRAANTVYQTEKFKNRGEFGELLLHALIRHAFDSVPAISKIFYKTSPNDPVKGFDAVHLVGDPNELELWLGEAKFYSDISDAVRDVVNEIEAHLTTDYLRSEFMLISGKVDEAWPHHAQLKRLLSPGTSLDEVFARACIPVLLTYDSPCVGSHDRCSIEYEQSFALEIAKHYTALATKLAGKSIPTNLRFHVFLMPLAEKVKLVEEFETRLKAWQSI